MKTNFEFHVIKSFSCKTLKIKKTVRLFGFRLSIILLFKLRLIRNATGVSKCLFMADSWPGATSISRWRCSHPDWEWVHTWFSWSCNLTNRIVVPSFSGLSAWGSYSISHESATSELLSHRFNFEYSICNSKTNASMLVKKTVLIKLTGQQWRGY